MASDEEKEKYRNRNQMLLKLLEDIVEKKQPTGEPSVDKNEGERMRFMKRLDSASDVIPTAVETDEKPEGTIAVAEPVTPISDETPVQTTAEYIERQQLPIAETTLTSSDTRQHAAVESEVLPIAPTTEQEEDARKRLAAEQARLEEEQARLEEERKAQFANLPPPVPQQPEIEENQKHLKELESQLTALGEELNTLGQKLDDSSKTTLHTADYTPYYELENQYNQKLLEIQEFAKQNNLQISPSISKIIDDKNKQREQSAMSGEDMLSRKLQKIAEPAEGEGEGVTEAAAVIPAAVEEEGKEVKLEAATVEEGKEVKPEEAVAAPGIEEKPEAVVAPGIEGKPEVQKTKDLLSEQIEQAKSILESLKTIQKPTIPPPRPQTYPDQTSQPTIAEPQPTGPPLDIKGTIAQPPIPPIEPTTPEDKISSLIKAANDALSKLQQPPAKEDELSKLVDLKETKKPTPTKEQPPTTTPIYKLPTIEPIIEHSHEVIDDIIAQEYTKSAVQKGFDRAKKATKALASMATGVLSNVLPAKRPQLTPQERAEQAKQQYGELYTDIYETPNIMVLEDHSPMNIVHEDAIRTDAAISIKDPTMLDNKVDEEIAKLKQQNADLKAKEPTKITRIKIEGDPDTKETMIMVVPDEAKTDVAVNISEKITPESVEDGIKIGETSILKGKRGSTKRKIDENEKRPGPPQPALLPIDTVIEGTEEEEKADEKEDENKGKRRKIVLNKKDGQ